MQFLKTLFWAAFAVVVVLFAHANWFPVGIKLWADLEADVKLPVLVFSAFLLGFLPTMIFYRARLWSMRRRLETHERNLVHLPLPPRTENPMPGASEPASSPQSEPTPS